MKIKEPDLSGTYTHADYLTWTWSEMTELIRGKIFNLQQAFPDDDSKPSLM